MKKLIALLLSLCMLVACGSISIDNFLTRDDWHCKELACTIKFEPDGDYRGAESLGLSLDEFTYNATERRIYLYEDGIPIHSYDIIYADNSYLVINAFGIVRALENKNAKINEPYKETKQYIDTDNLVLPYVTVLSCKDDILQISACDYDADAADHYEIWEVPLALACSARYIDVKKNGTHTSFFVNELSKEDRPLFGDSYTNAYLQFNAFGEVEAVTFYGEQHVE